MDENSLSDAQKLILAENIKNYIKEIFFRSFENLPITNDAISFAYGWCLLVYSTDYNILQNKLIKLKAEIYNDNINKNIEFIIEPTSKLSEVYSAKNSILVDLGFNNHTISLKINQIIDFVSGIFNSFLIKMNKFKPLMDELTTEEQKKIIFNEITNIH
ncbi:MAG: hypothetical protein ACK4OM_06560 [Alphaproteobacteria bacterium]